MATIPEALAVAVQHHQAGRLQAAEQVYRQILAVEPNQPNAIHLLGVLAHQVGNPELAVEYIERAIGLNGTESVFHNNLGIVFQVQGKLNEAVACCRRALELKPDFAEAHYNLGNAFQSQKKLDQAIACYRRALELKPDYAEAHNNLGNAFQFQEKLDEAIACCRRALELKPDFVEAYNNLGNAFKDGGKPDEAVACYRRALELSPGRADVYANLGIAFKDQGKLDEAVACYRRALELKSDFAEAYSCLLYLCNFHAGYDAETIYEEHRRWNQQFAEPLARLIQPHSNERSTDRRLRIGYVSPGFRSNVVGVFLLPLLEAHDHERFEIFCYASVRAPDTITDRCRGQADIWRNVLGYSDEELADTIRHDQVDILVDVTMHAADNRLLVFARKPAPVQVTYLAYIGTTGLTTMDYRLTDSYLDPPAQDDLIYSEESVRLPETYWCYRPLVQTPPVNALPALQTGQITFGCLNDFCKVTAPTLAIWIGVLQALPEARLLLHAHLGEHRDRVRKLLTQHDVSPERLVFAERVPMEEYFKLYHRMDVALDPFPYGGGATTCDALWMGVPVVSLAGQTAVGRGGLSILSNVGLADFVAYDSEQYVRIAVELARDVPRLGMLRATLRERMQRSPLMDAPRFARNVEAAYRVMWQRWCER